MEAMPYASREKTLQMLYKYVQLLCVNEQIYFNENTGLGDVVQWWYAYHAGIQNKKQNKKTTNKNNEIKKNS